MRELSLRHVAAIAVIAARLAAAQQQATGTSTTAPTTTTTTPSTPTTGGSTTGTSGRSTAPSSTQSSQPTRLPQPIFVAGNVTMPDGAEPPDRVLIERICSANRTRPEGYTDSKGRFSLQLGSQQLVADASEAFFGDSLQGTSATSTSSTNSTMDSLADCELRAKLPGYRSTTILLAGHRSMDNPNVGTLVIFPLTKDAGLSVSATSASAPKDARKALEKGISEAKKQKYDQAEKEFRKAVDLHPKYADAWLELGKVYAVKKNFDQARSALQRAMEADSKYVYPYEELYKIAFEQANWQELADTTNKLLRLNPYEFPAAYYYNGVANLQLKNLDEAQRSLQQALDGDKRLTNPKALYVMGLVLIQKREYQGAMDILTDFTQAAPNDSTAPKAKALLEELQKLR